MITRSKQVLMLLLLAALVGCVSIGCNTYRGFGKDVSDTGDAIQDK